jgi:hypothetical protein
MTTTTPTPTPENVAQTMRDTVERLGKTETITDGASPFTDAVLVSLPTGRKIQNVTADPREAAEYLKPARRKGTSQHLTLGSLIDWANRFHDKDSALFADTDPKSPSLTCVADYHHAGPPAHDQDGTDTTARHGHHRGIYKFPVSDEWAAWTEISGESLSKDDLAEFLTDHARDLLDPTPHLITGSGEAEPWELAMRREARLQNTRFGQVLDLLQISRSLSIRETSDLTLVKNQQTGEQQVQFLNEHKDPDGRPIDIPGLFLIAVPVFRGGAAYRLAVRLHYRKSGANITFTLTMHDRQRAYDDAIGEALELAASATGLPLFEGRPES